MDKELPTKTLSKKSAEKILLEASQLPTDHNELLTLLTKHGCSLDELIKVGVEGMKSTRIVRDRYGDVVAEDPDGQTRHKYFASFIELLGLIKKESINVSVVNISQRERELLDAYRNSEDGT